ncbi:tryptophan--tRNA ligase [Candidatus Gracilibacteria bacterium]|nr:tryptophan--tRNA ligase [Candidatus Gracilibacteria bacterium]
MKKRILTGLQATSDQLHIGNYFGSIKSMLDLSNEFEDAEIFLFTAIMHTYTGIHDGNVLKTNVMNSLKLFLACGADPNKFIIYNPADIAGHAQLTWVLTCLTIMGTMERMHSYKDALTKGKAGEIGVGTFCYPILMASDILLYDADLVPVGRDQKQHVEYARDIAQKFNNQYGETFKVPGVYIRDEVSVVPGTDGRKMSKSYNNYIGLLDDEKTVLKRVKQIPTSTQTVEESKNPDECNVYKILKLFLNDKENQEIRNRYETGGLSYKEVKDYLYEKIITFLKPIQEKYNQISDKEVLDLLEKNAKIVNEISNKKIEEIYKKIGFKL